MRRLVKCLMVLCMVMVLADQTSMAQINARKWSHLRADVTPYTIGTKSVKRSLLPGFYADKQMNYKVSSTYRLNVSNSNMVGGDSYWVGSVTQQSYNRGKIGRFYYWDVQGNLRDSFFFVDIAGGNKRGLKLVFPRNKSLF